VLTPVLEFLHCIRGSFLLIYLDQPSFFDIKPIFSVTFSAFHIFRSTVRVIDLFPMITTTMKTFQRIPPIAIHVTLFHLILIPGEV
jgi:hypothetical protein